MREARTSLPLRYRSINVVGAALRRIHPVASLDEQALCEAAMRATGLSDFGEPHFREGLRALLSSAEHDARLHFIGRVVLRQMIVNNLANRLLLVEARRSAPEVFQRPLLPPIIVLGLPRSGTTLLHRLLAADPAHRALEFWELLSPLPLRGGIGGACELRRREIEKQFRRRLGMVPDLDRKHFIRPDSPEECMWLQNSSFVSMSFWAVAPVYSYLDWYIPPGSQPGLRRIPALAAAAAAGDPRRRLTLKAPAHTGSLAALHRTLPDALLIQTHRDPVTSQQQPEQPDLHAASNGHRPVRPTADGGG